MDQRMPLDHVVHLKPIPIEKMDRVADIKAHLSITSPAEVTETVKMAAITSAVIAIAAVILGWLTIEIACKPCLDRGRQAIDQSLNPDYDPDDASAPPTLPLLHNPAAATTTT